VSIAVKVALRLEIARTLYSTSSNMNVVNRDVAAASFSAKNVIVPCFFCRSAEDVLHGDVLDHDAVCWVAGGTTVEVVLLNVDSVDGNVLDADVFEQDVGDEAGSVGIGLDASSVLGVENDGVCEGNVCHVVV
jgi:hypothetical protein